MLRGNMPESSTICLDDVEKRVNYYLEVPVRAQGLPLFSHLKYNTFLLVFWGARLS